ncbi:MAG: hypothetical protein ACRDRX_04480 [Pseudonocardiaceae bacterium]
MSTVPGCGHCDQPVPDGGAICSTCADGLMRQLRDVPELLEHLFITYAKQDKIGLSSQGHRGKLAEAPLPVRLDITRVIDGLSNELVTWARVLVDHHGWDVPNPPRRRPHNGQRGVVIPTSSPAVDLACYAATWLAQHVGHLRMHPAALEAYRDLTGAIEAAEPALDRPERQLYIGDCALCSGPLYAPLDATATRCERCGTHVADLPHRWDAAKRRLRGYPATAADIAGWIATLYGVAIQEATIRKWHEREVITPVDWVSLVAAGKRKVPRFRIGAVIDRAEKAKRRKAT